MATYQQGALKTGTTPSEYTNVGYATFTQFATLQADLAGTGAANYDVTITLPAGAQIVNIYADSTVAWTASGTVVLTAGITAGGTEYITTVDLKTVTRSAPTLSAAQLAAMANIGTNTSLILRAAVSAAAGTYVGTTKITVLYIPKS